jgi:HPt (histidine-containing phosphotransfer) domain-containing protein
VGSQVSDIDARLGDLARKFVARTGAEILQMRAALALLETGDRSGLPQILELAHRACGTGGTLGLLALSDAAGELERRAEACAAEGIPDAAERAQIAAGIDAMAAQLALLQERIPA